MKVIVNNQTPLTIEDAKGNVLFQWLPEQPKVTTYVNIQDNFDSDKFLKKINKMLRDKENDKSKTFWL